MNTVEDTDSPEAPTMTAETAPLTAHDRCDRCGAQAYVRVMMPRDPIDLVSGEVTLPGELLFCAHHINAHKAVLMDVAEGFHDERKRLKEGA